MLKAYTGRHAGLPLHEAAGAGHTGIVEDLLRGRCDPRGRDAAAETALLRAARRGYVSVVEVRCSQHVGSDPASACCWAPRASALSGDVGGCYASCQTLTLIFMCAAAEAALTCAAEPRHRQSHAGVFMHCVHIPCLLSELGAGPRRGRGGRGQHGRHHAADCVVLLRA